jgi:cytochrome c-type biogenesis protein CcmH
MKRILKLFILLLLISTQLYGFELEEKLKDSNQERRAAKLFTQVKCMVCKGEDLSLSEAQHAKAMRFHIRSLIKNGKSDAEIIKEISNSYGSSAIKKINYSTIIFLVLISLPVIYFFMRQIKWR